MVIRRIGAIAASAAIAAFGGWILVTRAQQKPSAARTVALNAHQTLGGSSAFRNLTVFPVYDSSSKSSDAYTTLDEGLRARLVKVKEAKGGGAVNTLYVTNSGRKPLYLMAGEVVLGGQQDRTLARDTIVPPGKHNIPITVFCVEHGRWSGRSEFGLSAPAVAGLSIRASAMNGEFNAAKGQVVARVNASAAPAMAGRPSQQMAQGRILGGTENLAGGRTSYGGDEVAEAQQKVWDGVAEKNSKLRIQNQTGTYRDALTMKSGDARTSVPAYVKSLSGSLGNDTHLVGVVAAVNGKIIAADIFSDPVLFRKLWPKLLRSYAADAVEQADGAGRAPVKKNTVTAREVKMFMAQAKNEQSKEENISDDGRRYRYDSKAASVYTLIPTEKAHGSAATPLHESVLSK
jgi:hypothetical protein